MHVHIPKVGYIKLQNVLINSEASLQLYYTCIYLITHNATCIRYFQFHNHMIGITKTKYKLKIEFLESMLEFFKSVLEFFESMLRNGKIKREGSSYSLPQTQKFLSSFIIWSCLKNKNKIFAVTFNRKSTSRNNHKVSFHCA